MRIAFIILGLCITLNTKAQNLDKHHRESLAQNSTHQIGNFEILKVSGAKISQIYQDNKVYALHGTYICLGHKNGGVVEVCGEGSILSINHLEKELFKIQKRQKSKNVIYHVGACHWARLWYKSPRLRCPDPILLICLPEISQVYDNQIEIYWQINPKYYNYMVEKYYVFILDLCEDVLVRGQTKDTSIKLDVSNLERNEDNFYIIRVNSDNNPYATECSNNGFKLPDNQLIVDCQDFKATLNLNKLADRLKDVFFLETQNQSADVLQ